MITRELEVLRPRTAGEALEILERSGDDATILAGGMSLMPMMNLGIVRPGLVVSLNHVTDLAEITYDGVVRVGAMARHQAVASSGLIAAHVPLLAEAALRVGDVQVRNRGTIGGSISHADPSADYMPVVVVAAATIELTSASGVRVVPVGEFFIDFMFTTREPNELVTAVLVPPLPKGSGSSYLRFARVEGSFPIVNAAAIIEPGFASTRVAIGGVGPTPELIDATDVFVNGVDPAGLEEVSARAYEAASEASSDVHSDAEYRRHMAGVFARRAVEDAASAMTTS